MMDTQMSNSLQSLGNTIVRQQSIIKILLGYILTPPGVEGLQALRVLQQRLGDLEDGKEVSQKKAARNEG